MLPIPDSGATFSTMAAAHREYGGEAGRTGCAVGLIGFVIGCRAVVLVEGESRTVNQERVFRGHIVNAENIGKISDELVARWNEEHPDDTTS